MSSLSSFLVRRAKRVGKKMTKRETGEASRAATLARTCPPLTKETSHAFSLVRGHFRVSSVSLDGLKKRGDCA